MLSCWNKIAENTATETISDFLNVGRNNFSQQALSNNAALPCVTGCVDAVVLPIVRRSDREHLFVRKEEILAILNAKKIICGWITKRRLKHAICLRFLSCRKLEFLISQGSVATCNGNGNVVWDL